MCEIVPTPPTHILQIYNNGGETLVTIHPDGTLTYGPNYTPDEAAKIFWGAIVQYMPASIKV